MSSCCPLISICRGRQGRSSFQSRHDPMRSGGGRRRGGRNNRKKSPRRLACARILLQDPAMAQRHFNASESPSPASSDWLGAINSQMHAVVESGIVEVFNYGRDRQGLIPLWVGEGDLTTPDFIADAAKRSLDDGETFYTYQRGIPELR